MVWNMTVTTHAEHAFTHTYVCSGAVYLFVFVFVFVFVFLFFAKLRDDVVGRTCCTLPYLLFFYFIIVLPHAVFLVKLHRLELFVHHGRGDSRFTLLIDRLITLLIGCIRDASCFGH